MKHLIRLIPFILLSGCAAPTLQPAAPAGPPVPPPAEDTCNANRYATLIGQDATALERVLIMDEVRVVRPGDAVTMDFRPERINFNIGTDNRIATITCT